MIACSAFLVACGQQTVPTATAGTGFRVAASPPSSGLEEYARIQSDGSWKPSVGHSGHVDDWGKKGDWGRNKSHAFDNCGFDCGVGVSGFNGCSFDGLGCGGNVCGFDSFGCSGFDGCNPWGFPYYVPPIYVDSSFGNPFAPLPLAAGPWINPFFGPLGWVGI
jgi:hypothetical protein